MGVRTSITENEFQQKDNHQQELSLLLGADSFLYGITDQNQQLLALRDVQLSDRERPHRSFRQLLDTDDLLQREYRQVNVVWTDRRSTLVPRHLFEADHPITYLEHLFETDAHTPAHFDRLHQPEAYQVYTVAPEWEQLLRRKYPNARHHHIIRMLLAGYTTHAAHEEFFLAIHTRDEQLWVTYLFQNRLQYTNVFTVRSPQDVVYFTLLVFQEQKLAPANATLYLSGELVQHSETNRLLDSYVGELKPLPAPIGLKYGTQFSETIPPALYFDLLSTCVETLRPFA